MHVCAILKIAILAQLVERIHGKDEVPSSILGDGSREKRTLGASQEVVWNFEKISYNLNSSCKEERSDEGGISQNL